MSLVEHLPSSKKKQKMGVEGKIKKKEQKREKTCKQRGKLKGIQGFKFLKYHSKYGIGRDDTIF